LSLSFSKKAIADVEPRFGRDKQSLKQAIALCGKTAAANKAVNVQDYLFQCPGPGRRR